MAHGSIINKGSDIRLVSGYCSQADSAAMIKGRAVALRLTTTVFNADTGAGFGFAVDYPLATSSFCAGVLYGGKTDDTTFADQSMCQIVTRGPLASTLCSGTITSGASWLGPSTVVTGAITPVLAAIYYPFGLIGYPLGAIADNTTSSIAIYVNTLLS